MALAIDANITTTFTSNQSPFQSSTFTTAQGGELILVLFSNDASPTGISNTPGALTWTKLQDEESFGAPNGIIYYAWASGILTNSQVSITAGVGQQGIMTILSFTGADATVPGSSAIGASTAGGNAASVPSLAITTTRNNSWIFGAFGGGSTTLVAGSGQTLFGQYLDSAFGGRGATIKQNSTTPTSGTNVTTSLTSSQAWNGAVVEILPALTGGSQYSSNLTTLGAM